MPALQPEVLEALIDCDYRRASACLGWELTPEFRESLGLEFLDIQLKLIRSHPERADWCVRAIVQVQDGVVVGHTGFHGPPELVGRAEIGYHVFAAYRGRGYASESAMALVGWAQEQGHDTVYASVSPENAASLAVLRKLGFRRSEGRNDETGDDLELFEVHPGWHQRDLRNAPAPVEN